MARTTTTKLSARDRARAARAKLDAAEREHHKLVEDGVIAYYEADDAREVAVNAVAAAETARAAAITTLSELKQSITRIASLTGLGASEVRKLKRVATPDTNEDNSDEDATPATDGPSQVETTAASATEVTQSTGPSSVVPDRGSAGCGSGPSTTITPPPAQGLRPATMRGWPHRWYGARPCTARHPSATGENPRALRAACEAAGQPALF